MGQQCSGGDRAAYARQQEFNRARELGARPRLVAESELAAAEDEEDESVIRKSSFQRRLESGQQNPYTHTTHASSTRNTKNASRKSLPTPSIIKAKQQQQAEMDRWYDVDMSTSIRGGDRTGSNSGTSTPSWSKSKASDASIAHAINALNALPPFKPTVLTTADPSQQRWKPKFSRPVSVLSRGETEEERRARLELREAEKSARAAEEKRRKIQVYEEEKGRYDMYYMTREESDEEDDYSHPITVSVTAPHVDKQPSLAKQLSASGLPSAEEDFARFMAYNAEHPGATRLPSLSSAYDAFSVPRISEPNSPIGEPLERKTSSNSNGETDRKTSVTRKVSNGTAAPTPERTASNKRIPSMSRARSLVLGTGEDAPAAPSFHDDATPTVPQPTPESSIPAIVRAPSTTVQENGIVTGNHAPPPPSDVQTLSNGLIVGNSAPPPPPMFAQVAPDAPPMGYKERQAGAFHALDARPNTERQQSIKVIGANILTEEDDNLFDD